MLVDTVVKQAE